MNKRKFLVGLLVGILVFIGLFSLSQNKKGQPTIPEASTVIASPVHSGEKKIVKAEGRIAAYPGAEVEISTEVPGTIAKIYVEEKQTVKKNDLILELKSDEEKAALAEAKAQFSEAKSHLWYNDREVERAKKLAATKTISTDALERAQRDKDAAYARLQEAKAKVTRLESILDKTIIRAPIDGIIVGRYVHSGETLQARVPIVKIVDLHRLRIEAEVDEYDTGRVTLGRNVKISAEGFDATWNGKVEEIPDVVVRKRSEPQDPAKTLDTRVLVVKIAFQETTPLKLGQRVEVEIADR